MRSLSSALPLCMAALPRTLKSCATSCARSCPEWRSRSARSGPCWEPTPARAPSASSTSRSRLALRDQEQGKEAGSRGQYGGKDEGARERPPDHRAGERGAERHAREVESHRDGEGAAEPGRVGAPLAEGEERDVDGADEQAADGQGCRHHEEVGRNRYRQKGKAEGELWPGKPLPLAALAVQPPEEGGGEQAGHAHHGEEDADRRRPLVEALQNQHREGDVEDPVGDVGDRDGHREAAQGLVAKHVAESLPGVEEEVAGRLRVGLRVLDAEEEEGTGGERQAGGDDRNL